jgi:hypothetical protein
MIRPASLISLTLLAIAAACSDDPAPAPREQRDPAIARALDDPLMTDPDLSSRNEGNAAITVRTDDGLPLIQPGEDDIAAARAEAAALTGGKPIALPPAARKVEPLPPRHTPADHLAVLADKTACRARLVNSTIWAARLPQALPIYPRGATQGATGGEGSNCRIAAVVFTTPVPASEVLAFYWQRAKAAGLAPTHLTGGEWAVLQGGRDGEAFDVRAARAGDTTTVELATLTG